MENSIAFVCRMGGNHLFVAPADGSGVASQLTFTGNNEDPSWSPDGKYLVFSTNFGRAEARNIALVES